MGDPQTCARELHEASTGELDEKSDLRAVLERCQREPVAYVLDAGRWLDSRWTMGMVSGSHMITCELSLSKEASVLKTGTALDKALDAFRKTILSPVVIDHKVVSPWRPADFAYPEEILLKKDKLLVVIPDCHLGIRDEGDQFSPSCSIASVRALLGTIKVLRNALQKAVKIVQLGDFVEVWETEASPDIYHKKVNITYLNSGSEDVWNVEGQESKVLLRPRLERAERAIAKVWDKFKDTKIASAQGLFDLVLPGNHDIERMWIDSPFDALGTLVRKRRIRTGRDLCIVMEHGHHLDKHNHTRKAEALGVGVEHKALGVPAVLETVDGKPITYAYARNKPGRRWRDPVPADEKEWWVGMLHTPPSLLPGRGVVVVDVMQAFQDMGLVDSYGEQVIMEVHSEYMRQLISEAHYKNESIKSSYSTYEPESYEIPVRLWIHAHTHNPGITSFAWRDVAGKKQPLGWLRHHPRHPFYVKVKDSLLVETTWIDDHGDEKLW